MWPQRGKIEISEKRLWPTAQNHYAELEDTSRDKITKFCVIVRYTKKVIEKRRLWSNLNSGGRLTVTFCCNNTHCNVSLPHLTLPTSLNTVLIAIAFCPQTAITDVQYPTLQRPLAVGNTLSVSTHFNCITFVNLIHVFLPLDFVIMQKFFKNMLYYGQLVEECFANTTFLNTKLVLCAQH
jgi:hypothetical protein